MAHHAAVGVALHPQIEVALQQMLGDAVEGGQGAAAQRRAERHEGSCEENRQT